MADKLVRGNSMDGAIRVFAAVTTDLVNEAQRRRHSADCLQVRQLWVRQD